MDLNFASRKDSKHFLFISDVHFDSVKCDRELLYSHLEEAKSLNASVFIFGDLMDLMQGRWDPRGSYADLRPEYKSVVYVDEVIQDVGEKLSKYADVIKFISKGNHETNIEKRMMVSPIDRVAQIIGSNGGHVHCRGSRGPKAKRRRVMTVCVPQRSLPPKAAAHPSGTRRRDPPSLPVGLDQTLQDGSASARPGR